MSVLKNDEKSSVKLKYIFDANEFYKSCRNTVYNRQNTYQPLCSTILSAMNEISFHSKKKTYFLIKGSLLFYALLGNGYSVALMGLVIKTRIISSDDET